MTLIQTKDVRHDEMGYPVSPSLYSITASIIEQMGISRSRYPATDASMVRPIVSATTSGPELNTKFCIENAKSDVRNKVTATRNRFMITLIANFDVVPGVKNPATKAIGITGIITGMYLWH